MSGRGHPFDLLTRGRLLGLSLMGSTSWSPLFSNIEINEFAGGRFAVSGRPSELVVERLTAGLSVLTWGFLRIGAGSPRRDLPTAVLSSPPPCAAGPEPGLTLLLAASVAAMKLVDLGSAVVPAALPPGGSKYGLLDCSEPGDPRNRARRSLSCSVAWPMSLSCTILLLPVVCLLILPFPAPVPCLLSRLPPCRLLTLPVGDRALEADVAATSAPPSCGVKRAGLLELGVRLWRRACCCCLEKAREAPRKAASWGVSLCGPGALSLELTGRRFERLL